MRARLPTPADQIDPVTGGGIMPEGFPAWAVRSWSEPEETIDWSSTKLDALDIANLRRIWGEIATEGGLELD